MNLCRSLFFCVLAISCTNNKNVVAPAGGDKDTVNAKMTAWITTSDSSKTLERQAAVPFTPATANGRVINIDTSKKYQSMEGFGYTLTGGSAQVINKMPADAKARLLQELFGDTEQSLRISFLRISIGASDLNGTVFTYDDVPPGQTDPELKYFSLEPDRAGVIPLLKEILLVNPDITIMGTPWTPPVWMKDNNNSVGGSLKPEFYDAYARYLVKYIQEMKKEGITVHAITPQNEPLHPGNNPSMLMEAPQQAAFIKNNLGPAFRSAGLSTRIIVYDHNCDRPDYPLTVLNDPGAKQFVDGSAFHLYAGDIKVLSDVHSAHPDKHVYFTEQYTAITSDFGGDLRWHLKNLIIGAPRNWSRTVLEWNLASDTAFGPHTPGGCTTCKGALTVQGATVKRYVAYYIIGHASRFVPKGSVRVDSDMSGSLYNVAFVTPEGKVVVIVLNDGNEAVDFSIKTGGSSAQTTLPAGAVGTYVI